MDYRQLSSPGPVAGGQYPRGPSKTLPPSYTSPFSTPVPDEAITAGSLPRQVP